MSQNFELMTQLEIEADVTDRRNVSAANRTAEMEVVPILSPHTTNDSGEEILRLISVYSYRPTDVPCGRSFSAGLKVRMVAVLFAPRLDVLSLQTVLIPFAWSTPMCGHLASRVCLELKGRTLSQARLLLCASSV
jgi:hypothetical protein